MNLTAHTHSSTWKTTRNRYIAGISGVALALSIAIGGISALPSLGSREASVTSSVQVQSRPSTLFATEADAALALDGVFEVTPQFANSGDAYDAAIALSFVQPVSNAAGSDDALLGIGQPGERAAAVNPQFANSADAYEASIALSFAQPVSTAAGSDDALLGIGQPGERAATVNPQFANSADAYEASIALSFAQPVSTIPTDSRENYLGLGQPGVEAAPLFSNMADAEAASR